MENNIQIVHIPPEEWRDFKKLRLEALKNDPQAFGKSYKEANKEPDEKWKKRLLDAGMGKSWSVFAKVNGKSVGMIQAAIHSDEPNKVWLHAAYVDKKQRRKGIGKKLMEQIIKEVAQSNSPRIMKLTVNKNQTAASNLYKKYGFEVIGEQNFVMGNGEKVRELVMEKII